LRAAAEREAEAMLATTLTYIETDFAHALETHAEYRHRTFVPRKRNALRRLLALA
jgi:hypothetical protein